MSAPMRHAARGGFSLVEVLIALSLLSMVALGLAGSATLALSQVAKARQDLQYSADVEQVADSIVAAGYTNAVSGSETIRGRSVSWVVSNPTAKSRQVEMVVQRRGLANTSTVFSDTLRLFLSK
jgi:prepilin-type N-terminal cleavage/methylation domain-containing protein